MSAKRKQGAVLRLFKGEPIELVSRKLVVPAGQRKRIEGRRLSAGCAPLSGAAVFVSF
jgi:hypothetical protein